MCGSLDYRHLHVSLALLISFGRNLMDLLLLFFHNFFSVFFLYISHEFFSCWTIRFFFRCRSLRERTSCRYDGYIERVRNFKNMFSRQVVHHFYCMLHWIYSHVCDMCVTCIVILTWTAFHTPKIGVKIYTSRYLEYRVWWNKPLSTSGKLLLNWNGS